MFIKKNVFLQLLFTKWFTYLFLFHYWWPRVRVFTSTALHKAQTVSTQIHRDKQEHNSVSGAKLTNYETNSVPAVQRTIEFSSGSISSLFSSESISNITQYHCSFNINSLNHRRLCVCPGFLCLRITPAILSLYLQLTLSSGRTVTQLLEILCAEGPVHMLSIHSQLHASASRPVLAKVTFKSNALQYHITP